MGLYIEVSGCFYYLPNGIEFSSGRKSEYRQINLIQSGTEGNYQQADLVNWVTRVPTCPEQALFMYICMYLFIYSTKS